MGHDSLLSVTRQFGVGFQYAFFRLFEDRTDGFNRQDREKDGDS